MNFRGWICLIDMLALMLVSPFVLRAEVVTEVLPDGTLLLEGGTSVVLSGVRIDEEGISVLRVLARGQNLRIRPETPAASGPKPSVYAYLRAKSLKFPHRADAPSEEEEVMLNAFLISQGAARVAEGEPFAEKDHFLNLQEQAKKAGSGVWSYERD